MSTSQQDPDPPEPPKCVICCKNESSYGRLAEVRKASGQLQFQLKFLQRNDILQRWEPAKKVFIHNSPCRLSVHNQFRSLKAGELID